MNLSTEFVYNIAYVTLFQPNTIMAIIGVVMVSIIGVILQYIFLYALGAFIMRRERKTLEHKKKVLQELILMKDIQTEIEKEIEKSMLSETFNG
jgi:uncharacterized protein (DUF2062 family)